MEKTTALPYDVFISYSPTDRDWVEQWLIPPLEHAKLRVSVDYRDFIAGMPRLENIERAITNSRRTLVVLTPEWLDSEWNAFEGLLVRSLDPAARQRKLLPLLLRPCELPVALAALERLDLSAERHWEGEILRLIRDVEDSIPVTPPWREGHSRDLVQWRRWVRRYRRTLGRILMGLAILWLCLTLLFQWPPFQPRAGWVSLGLKAPNATRLFRHGDLLIVGSKNTQPGCNQPQVGLWYSSDLGVTWNAAHAPLEFTRPPAGCLVADIQDLAGTPERLYAATSDVGVLTSIEQGRVWQNAGALPGIAAPDLVAVAAAPDAVARVYTLNASGGLFRSLDGGDYWERLDTQRPHIACAQGRPFTSTLVASALLVTSQYVIVGTGDYRSIRVGDIPAGLYMSTDDGDCWQRLSPIPEDLYYLQIAMTRQEDQLVTLVHNPHKEAAERPHEIWLWELSTPGSRFMLEHFRVSISTLVVQGDFWYGVTPPGGVVEGPLKMAGGARWLSKFMAPCWLTCDVALTAMEADTAPMLLLGRSDANSIVARYQESAHWRHRFWP